MTSAKNLDRRKAGLLILLVAKIVHGEGSRLVHETISFCIVPYHRRMNRVQAISLVLSPSSNTRWSEAEERSSSQNQKQSWPRIPWGMVGNVDFEDTRSKHVHAG